MEKPPLAIIGLDMDGTLLDGNRQLTTRTIETMRRAAEAGVQLVVDSGRKFEIVPKELREMDCMRYYVLCNGAEIYDKQENKVIYRAEIPLDKALLIYDDLVSYGDVFLDSYMSDAAWSRKEDLPKIDRFVADPSHRDILYNTRIPVENFRERLIERGKPVYKFQTIYGSTSIRDAEMARLRKNWPDMYITNAYTYNLEVNVPEATKGGGLLKLAEILGCPRERVYAFGDSMNDLSMIESADIGYAMANADDALKAVADRIAPPNTEDGVAQVLEELFL